VKEKEAADLEEISEEDCQRQLQEEQNFDMEEDKTVKSEKRAGPIILEENH